jgi:MFS family permease
VGVAYLLTGAAPNLVFACAASVVGGAGNGIEWVALVTAVQQLTRAEFQARVASLIESVAKAAPGIGFLIGGATAALFTPRVSYGVAGVGVIVVLVIAAIALTRAGWRGDPTSEVDVGDALGEAASAAQIPDSAAAEPLPASDPPLEAPETAPR